MSIPQPSPSRSPAPSQYIYPPASSPSRQGQRRERSSISESTPPISYPFKQERRDRSGSSSSERSEKGYHYIKSSSSKGFLGGSGQGQYTERMMDGYQEDGLGMRRNGSQDGRLQNPGVEYGYTTPYQANYSSTALSPSPSYQTSLQPQPYEPSTSKSTPNKPSKSRQWLGTKAEKIDITELDEEEKEMLEKGLVDWNELKSWRFWFRKEWLWWYLLGSVIATLVILMTLYHKQIVNWLHPVAIKMKELPCGWLVPIGLLILVSQPPLFGAEIVEILCGLVWGLWIGFAITVAGTFLGELINFYLFRYLLRKRAEKMEKKNMSYGLLSHVIREGGIVMATIVRLSAIPGHVSTVVFSTCGLSVWIFIVATIISMPKHIIIVYLGTLLSSTASNDKKSKIINDSVLAITFFITLLAAWFIWRKMKKARVPVWRARRAELAAKGMDMSSLPMDPSGYADRPHNQYGRDSDKIEQLDDARSPILANAAEPSRRSVFESGITSHTTVTKMVRRSTVSMTMRHPVPLSLSQAAVQPTMKQTSGSVGTRHTTQHRRSPKLSRTCRQIQSVGRFRMPPRCTRLLPSGQPTTNQPRSLHLSRTTIRDTTTRRGDRQTRRSNRPSHGIPYRTQEWPCSPRRL